MNLKNKAILCLLAVYTLIPTFYLSKNIVTIFSHGIADTWKQVRGYVKSYKKHDDVYRNDRYLFHTPCVAFNYPDATNKFYRVNYNETSFGQENEISRLNKAYRSTLARHDNCDIILWGLSRGASNVLIFAGLYQPSNVKALLLESPYFTMGVVIENIMVRQNIACLRLL